MITLAIDTSAHLCATCIYDAANSTAIGEVVEDIGRGHAERLFPAIEEALRAASRSYEDVERLGVCVGPGSFTGVRVGVSAMRGLALALSCPVVGVSVFDALILNAPRGRPVLIVQDARRNEVYAQLFDDKGTEATAPAVISFAAAADLAQRERAVLLGSGAPLVAGESADTGLEILGADANVDVVDVARCATAKKTSDDAPKPLYLRSADAKPQTGFALPREVPAS